MNQTDISREQMRAKNSKGADIPLSIGELCVCCTQLSTSVAALPRAQHGSLADQAQEEGLESSLPFSPSAARVSELRVLGKKVLASSTQERLQLPQHMQGCGRGV